MIRAILVGACGKMGNNITECAENDNEITVVAGVDKFNNGKNYPVFPDFNKINTEADVDHILEALPQVVSKLRNMSPVWENGKPAWHTED